MEFRKLFLLNSLLIIIYYIINYTDLVDIKNLEKFNLM